MQHLISVDRADVQRLLNYLSATPKLLKTARQRALNRTGMNVQTAMIRRLTRVLNVKARKLKNGSSRYGTVKLYKVYENSDSARVAVTGKRMPLSRFGARQVAKGVSYRILKTGGRKTVYGFLARGRRGDALTAEEGASGFVGVFKRLGRKRLPIQQLFGPSIPHVAEQNPQVLAAIMKEAPDTLLKNVAQQVGYVINRRTGKK